MADERMPERICMAEKRPLKSEAPLIAPEDFSGPVAWWANSLTCGGVERQIVASAREFQRRGLPVTLLCSTVSPQGGNDFFLEEARAVCREVQEFGLEVVDTDIFALARRKIAVFLSGATPDFYNVVAAYAGWMGRVRPRLLQIWNADLLMPLLAAVIVGVPRIIVAGQSLSPAQRSPYGFEGIDDVIAFKVLSNLLRLPHVRMTNNSRAGCASYEAWLGLAPGSVALTPNIFDTEAWDFPDARRESALRQSLGIGADAPVLGGLFRFVSIKDPDLWVSVAARACAAHPDLYAVVGGDGEELARMEKQVADSPFAGRILFPGPVRDVPAFLSMCSVFLHTAHVEGLPNVLLEAQAMQVPVVTTLCGGAADAVEHGKSGFVLGKRDEEELAAHVSFFLRHENMAREAGRAGREHVEREFCVARSAGLLWQVYAEMLPNDMGEIASAPVEDAAPAAPEHLEEGEEPWPLVSIVLPTYNHLAWLPQAVDSVLAQDYPQFELIIVDDGSTDGTGEYLASLDSPRVRVLGGPNTRLPTALNRGFALTQGELRTWTSADNICLPHFCSTLVRALRAFPQAGFASASFASINSRGLVMDKLGGEPFLETLLCSNRGVAAFMYRKNVAQQAGEYDARLEGAEDWDMWLRILDITQPVHVPAVVYQYRWHNDSLSAKIPGKVREASARTAHRALQRLEKRGGVHALYPWIDACANRNLALFHANLALGVSMLAPDSFLKGAAAVYLARAHRLRPDDLAAMGNYAVALAWHGRMEEAGELLRRGESAAPEQFGLLRKACGEQRRRWGSYEFVCPLIAGPGPDTSELLGRARAAQQVFVPGITGQCAGLMHKGVENAFSSDSAGLERTLF